MALIRPHKATVNGVEAPFWYAPSEARAGLMHGVLDDELLDEARGWYRDMPDSAWSAWGSSAMPPRPVSARFLDALAPLDDLAGRCGATRRGYGLGPPSYPDGPITAWHHDVPFTLQSVIAIDPVASDTATQVVVGDAGGAETLPCDLPGCVIATAAMPPGTAFWWSAVATHRRPPSRELRRVVIAFYWRAGAPYTQILGPGLPLCGY